MESPSNANPSVFGDLQVDNQSTVYLGETARWARFLSIVGFVLCGFMVLGSFFMGSFMSSMGAMGNMPGGSMFGGASLTIFYLLLAILYFFPCLYLYRFSGKMQEALQGSQQASLIDSFRNLKSCFKFMGILTIVMISLYILVIVFAVIFAASYR